MKISGFYPIFKSIGVVYGIMEEELTPELEQKLRKAGEELRARHDDAIIADVIGEVEELEDDSASETADLLRFMVEERE